jgi:predicted CopG family antitoxin
VILLSRYQTISVPREVKATLEKAKGDKEWGAYLLDLYAAAEEAKKERALRRLRELLPDKDLEEIAKNAKEFRENLRLK